MKFSLRKQWREKDEEGVRRKIEKYFHAVCCNLNYFFIIENSQSVMCHEFYIAIVCTGLLWLSVMRIKLYGNF